MPDSVRRGLRIASFAFLVCVTVASASAQESKFEHLARPQFSSLSWIDGMSADGSRVVATFTKNPEGVDRPVAWDAAGTARFLDLLPDPGYAGPRHASYRQPLSADGSLIGGYCQTGGNGVPVFWDAGGAIRQLPYPFSGYVSSVSPNGACLYGSCQTLDGYFRPFRWTADGEATMLQSLSGEGALVGHHIAATSTDGTVAVGADEVIIAGYEGRDYRPVRWKADGSVEALPLLGKSPDGLAQGEAQFCSSDGSVVVGWLTKYSGTGAYLGRPNVCWLPDGRVVEVPGGMLAMTPDGKTIVGDARMDLLNGQFVRTELGYTEFGGFYALDVSDDGRVMAGGSTPNAEPKSVRGAWVWIDNRMYKLEELLAKRGVSLPEGWKSLHWINFCSADGTVFVGEGTFNGELTAFRATIPDIFADKEEPVFDALAPIRKFCDRGKTFATVQLRTPKATDDAPGTVVVTTTAGSRFPIGTTNVDWTATDAEGNVARATQKVIVTNRQPTANAGRNLTITTSSEKGARVSLNGSGSSDPDEHALKFDWTAKGVRLSRATTAKPVGVFPIGTTTATLAVVDAGGAKDADRVRVRVRLKNAKRRPRGADANRSFASATREAAKAAFNRASGSPVLSGLAYANAASAYGDAAGEFVRWEEGQTEADSLPAYAELRRMQGAYGRAATQALLSAYAETGDESLFSAYGYAAYGTAYAAADLTEK